MNNRERYRFDDFTLANYERLVNMAKANGFLFAPFAPAYPTGGKIALWRHDVEFSPHAALRMAEIEAAAGVRATYFLQLHCEFYNVLEKEVSAIVKRVRTLGHDIGLHFDSHFFDIRSEAGLSECLALDAAYFNRVFGLRVAVFSFHCTDPFVLSCEREEYAGLLNAYSGRLKRDFAYCADSTGYWRHDRLEDLLNDATIQRLHVLTHDSMWSEAALAPRQRVFKAIQDQAQRLRECYDATLRQYGAMNIDET